MKDYPVYLFDFDGTLFDTKLSLRKVFRDAFASVGMTCTDEQSDKYMHQYVMQTIEERNVPKEQYAIFGRAIEESIDDPATIAENAPFPETQKVLKELLGKNKRIGIVSGNSSKHIQRVWSHWNFPQYAEVFVGSEMYQHGKPSPEPLLVALREMKIAPSHDVLYVGDSLQDIEAADAAGIDSLLIDRENEYASFSREKIHSLLEILKR